MWNGRFAMLGLLALALTEWAAFFIILQNSPNNGSPDFNDDESTRNLQLRQGSPKKQYIGWS